MAENKLQLFKPDATVIEIAGNKEKIVFDMNAVLELEKIYGSIDTVFKLLFNQTAEVHVVKVNNVETDINTITIDDAPLAQFVQAAGVAKATIKDTINLAWVGMLHSHAKRDEDGEIISCDMDKATVRNSISFKKLAEVNTQIVSAMIRDLIAPDKADDQGEVKN